LATNPSRPTPRIGADNAIEIEGAERLLCTFEPFETIRLQTVQRESGIRFGVAPGSSSITANCFEVSLEEMSEDQRLD
jgi:hypothetical protein